MVTYGILVAFGIYLLWCVTNRMVSYQRPWILMRPDLPSAERRRVIVEWIALTLSFIAVLIWALYVDTQLGLR